MTLRYETVDVFTETAFGGNPLAVVLGGETLTAEAMQAIAREFNCPETTFVMPPEDPSHTARVRIFTPGMELPFAGHPNVGTATVLAWRGEIFGRPVGDAVVFEEAIGAVGLEILRAGGTPIGARLTSPAMPTVRGSFDPSAVAAAVGLSDPNIVVARHAPAHVAIGATFVIAEVEDTDVLAAARGDAGYLVEWDFPSDLTMDVYLANKKAKAPRYAQVPETTFLRTYVCEDMTKCLCFYDAPSEAAVLRAREVVETPVTRVSRVTEAKRRVRA